MVCEKINMKNIGLAAILLCAMISAVQAAGLITDFYPHDSGIVIAKGDSVIWGMRITNDYDCKAINVTIQNVKDMDIMHQINNQTVFQIPAGFKQEILFNISIPADSARTNWQPTFVVHEVKADDPNSFIDTSISPQGSINVNVGPETLYAGQIGWQDRNLQPYQNGVAFNGTCEGQQDTAVTPTPIPTPKDELGALAGQVGNLFTGPTPPPNTAAAGFTISSDKGLLGNILASSYTPWAVVGAAVCCFGYVVVRKRRSVSKQVPRHEVPRHEYEENSNDQPREMPKYVPKQTPTSPLNPTNDNTGPKWYDNPRFGKR